MKWIGEEGPGPLTRLFWALEDWWRSLEPVGKSVIYLLVLGAILWILVTHR